MSTQVVDELVIPVAAPDDAAWRDAVVQFVTRAREQSRVVTLTATEQVFSPAQVGRMTGTSKTGVQRRIDDGTIQAVRRGSRWLIPASEVERYRGFLLDGLARTVADEPFDD